MTGLCAGLVSDWRFAALGTDTRSGRGRNRACLRFCSLWRFRASLTNHHFFAVKYSANLGGFLLCLCLFLSCRGCKGSANRTSDQSRNYFIVGVHRHDGVHIAFNIVAQPLFAASLDVKSGDDSKFTRAKHQIDLSSQSDYPQDR